MRTEKEIRADLELVEANLRGATEESDALEYITQMRKLLNELEEAVRK